MWCSSITELRMRALGLKTDRLFSVFVEEEDLIFGCRKKIIQTLEEADIENGCSLVGVVVNCAPSLIGDDIEEICTGAAGTLPVAIVEAGEFCGDFDNGFSHALATIIGTFSPKKLPVAWKTVNLIGFCPIDYCALGTLQEMKRLLMECGISVNVTLGALGNSANSIAQIGSAALNIVINRARGLRSAEWLKENDESHLWELEQVEKTIFIPLGILFDHLYLKEITFAGFTGWNYFMERIFTQYRLLCM